ncbi:MAG: hypothetical protein HEQ32_06480 [Vampirovibrio sp.]
MTVLSPTLPAPALKPSERLVNKSNTTPEVSPEVQLLLIEAPSEDQLVLNDSLSRLEATQVPRPCDRRNDSAFLSKTVGNPQAVGDKRRNKAIASSLLGGLWVWAGLSLAENVSAHFGKKNLANTLTSKANHLSELAKISTNKEQALLTPALSWEELSKGLDLSKMGKSADTLRANYTKLVQNTPSWSDAMHASAGFLHNASAEVRQSRSNVLGILPFFAGLTLAGLGSWAAFEEGKESAHAQEGLNRRNRSIINQAGKDLTVKGAKETYPEYFSPVAADQKRFALAKEREAQHDAQVIEDAKVKPEDSTESLMILI